jgi:multidrug efflux pump subunit AcrA (membrane-fusion protein)
VFAQPGSHVSVGKRWIVASLLLVAVAVGGWLLGQQVQSPAMAASKADAPIASWVTAAVERRVLSRTLIKRGEVLPQTDVRAGVPSSVEGDAIVTSVPVRVGDWVAAGDRVLEVSGRPVFVLPGAIPAYRSLKPGMAGDDVAQLQGALTQIGCKVGDQSGTYGADTRACISKMYKDRGYEPIPVSLDDDAERLGAQQAVADARAALEVSQLALDRARRPSDSRELLKAELGLANARRGLDTATADAAESLDLARQQLAMDQATFDQTSSDPDAPPQDVRAARAARDESRVRVGAAERSGADAVAAARDVVVLAEADLEDAKRPPDLSEEELAVTQARAAVALAQDRAGALEAATGATVPIGEVVFVPTLPALVQATPDTVGLLTSDPSDTDGVPGPASGSDLVRLSSPEVTVSVRFDLDERPLVQVGSAAELLDELSKITYRGTIASIDDSARSRSDEEAGYLARIVPDSGHVLPPSTLGQSLRVTITAASTGAESLVVPVTAMTSSANGSEFVSIVPGGSLVTTTPVRVRVTAGLSADGFVAVQPVEPGTLEVNHQVVVGR